MLLLEQNYCEGPRQRWVLSVNSSRPEPFLTDIDRHQVAVLHTDISSSESGIIDDRLAQWFSFQMYSSENNSNSFGPGVTSHHCLVVLTHGPECGSYRLPSTMQRRSPYSPPPPSYNSCNLSPNAGDYTYTFGSIPSGTPSGTAQHRHNHLYVNVPTILRIFSKLATDTMKSRTGTFIPMKQHLFVSPPQTPQSPHEQLVENQPRI